MRTAFIDEIARLAEADERVLLVVGDLGFSVVERFAERFGPRFINAGIAEQNMMGLAAGLASEGFRPFVYSIANFPTFRCAEQIRNDVAYHRLAVTIVSVGGGLAYGNLGYSHHAVQDMALMRVLPHMTIAAPGDPQQVRACMRYLHAHPGPAYLRLGKAGEPPMHPDVPEVSPGTWLPVVVPEGARRTLLTTGAPLALAREWLARPEWAGYALHAMPLWGMGCKPMQAAQVARWDRVVTVEDHLPDGGFGSWLREAVSIEHPELNARIRTRALDPVVCGMVGRQETLNRAGGLA